MSLDDNARSGKSGEQRDADDCTKDEQWEHGPVYDGMITVEIPVPDDRAHAREAGRDISAEDSVQEPALRVSHR